MIDAKAVHYSPSQLSAFKACPRKWWIEKVAKVKVPSTAAQLLGTEVHAQIEGFIVEGKAPTDRRAWAGLAALGYDAADVLSPRDPRIKAEGDIKIAIPASKAGAPRDFVGIIDLFDISNPRLPVITDHKTTSDIKYAKTSYELDEDIQMNAYAKWAFDGDPTLDAVIVRHNAIPTKGSPTAILTSTKLERKDVERRWESYLDLMDQMDVARTQDVRDVEALGFKNGECEKYGGCPHKERCLSLLFGGATPQKVIPMNVPLKDKLSGLRKITGATDAPSVEAVETPAVKPTGLLEKRFKAAQAAVEDVVEEAEAPEAVATIGRLAALRQKMAPEKEAKAPKVKAAPKVEEQVETKAVERTKSRSNLDFLFVNCMPSPGLNANVLEAMRLEVFVAPILETIQRETGLNWQLHEYRRAPGYIADGIAQAELPNALIIDDSTPLGKVCLEALIPRALNIIVGTSA